MALAMAARLVHHPCCMMLSKNPRTPPAAMHHHHVHKPLITALTTSSFLLRSVDVSKDDTPLETATTTTPPTPETEQAEAVASPELEAEEEGPKVDPRRLEEKFAVLNTGVYECRSCGYRYDQAAGDPSYPVPPGLPFEQLPDDWRCPTCGAAQSFFESKSVEIAGFAQNQQFGLGGNSLTGDQKALLIYGSLLVGFLFFLSGYFLQ
uniref:Rubredoxin-like domain-containing protein n=1 Tax=Oryza punctata TaxID=4537 RepID=A0A0E0LTS0_ORYPU